MAVYDKKKYLQEVKTVRENSFAASRAPIDQLQAFAARLSNADPPPGIERTCISGKGQDDVLNVLLKAINGLADADYRVPDLVDVPAEWSLPKQTAASNAPTLLYIHGGGFVYGSPGTARRNTKRLADLTKGRCIVPQYRKAPTDPFPAALLDVFIVYLSLLAPPPSSNHGAVSAAQLVFAGESSGLNLLMALIQVILYLRENGTTQVRFHDQNVPLQLPAGVAGLCGFFDLTCNLPSWSQKADFDVLPEIQPTYAKDWKKQALWPTDPPRADMYCEKSAMTHPLLSPVTAASWGGSPPMYIAVGDEMNRDGNLYIAKLAASQGVPVQLKDYENMCHVWSSALPKLPHSAHVINGWSEFIVAVTQGTSPPPTSASLVSFATLQERSLDISKLTNLTRQDILEKTAKAQQDRFIFDSSSSSKL